MADFHDQCRPWPTGFLAVAAKKLLPEVIDIYRDPVRALVREHVDEGAGFLLLSGLEQAVAPERYRDVVLWLSGCLGDVLPQDRSGTLVKEVRDRGTRIGEGKSARYSDSRFGGELHTDGAESPLPVPDYFLLCCLRPARYGGSLRLIPLDQVVAGLSGRPFALTTLMEDFLFDRRGDERPGDPPTVAKPVLFEAWNHPAVTYLRKYIEVGHSRPEVSDLSAKQKSALDALDEVLYRDEIAVEGRMRSGDVAVFNNLRLLHGRTEFIDYPDEERARVLYRTWIRRMDP